MKPIRLSLVCLLLLQIPATDTSAQIIGGQQDPFKIATGSSVKNLRVTKQSPDGTEATLDMEYAFDGASGPTALIVPVIEKKDQKGVSSWFGADPKIVSRGRGLVTIKVRYFNDEAGVPPQLSTDRIRMLILNSSGRSIVASSPFLKTIQWGSADAKPATTPSRRTGAPDKEKLLAEAKVREEAQLKAEAEAKVRAEAEAKAKVEAKTRETARLQAETEAKVREEARLKAEAEAQVREAARLKAETEAKRLADEKRLAEAKAKTEAQAREEARLKAETEAKVRRDAEERERAELARREEQRVKADAESKRLADEKRQAEAKSRAEAQTRETARLQAEAELKRLAEEKKIAEEKARAEAQLREATRLKAETEAKQQLEAVARKQAEDETKRLAEEKRKADEKLLAEIAAREEARLRAEAAATRLELERQLAEQQEKLETARREEARLKAEAEAQRLAAERKAAEAEAQARAATREQERRKAEAEAAARETARLQAEADAKLREATQRLAEEQARQLAEQKRQADEKAAIEAIAAKQAQEKAKAEAEASVQAEAKARAEAEARAVAEATAKTEAEAAARAKAEAENPVAQTPAAPTSVFTLASDLKSKINNVDVINRSQDRSRMTIEVEFEYRDSLGGKPTIGVAVARDGEPESVQYFDVTPVEFGKARKASLMIPVKFSPPTAKTQLFGNYGTDQVAVFLADASSAKQHHVFTAAMPLTWRAPGFDPNASIPVAVTTASSASAAPAPAAKKISASLEVAEFKQSDPYSGYVTVNYKLASGTAKLRARLVSAANPSASSAFDLPDRPVEAGSGLEFIKIATKKDLTASANIIEADALVVELLDEAGQVLASTRQDRVMTWARPK